MDPDQQPDKVVDLSNPLAQSQFSNSAKPSLILAVDRHSSSPDDMECCALLNQFY